MLLWHKTTETSLSSVYQLSKNPSLDFCFVLLMKGMCILLTTGCYVHHCTTLLSEAWWISSFYSLRCFFLLLKFWPPLPFPFYGPAVLICKQLLPHFIFFFCVCHTLTWHDQTIPIKTHPEKNVFKWKKKIGKESRRETYCQQALRWAEACHSLFCFAPVNTDLNTWWRDLALLVI